MLMFSMCSNYRRVLNNQVKNGSSCILFYKKILFHRLFLLSAKYNKQCTDLVMSTAIYLKRSKKSSRQTPFHASNFPEVLSHVMIKTNV